MMTMAATVLLTAMNLVPTTLPTPDLAGLLQSLATPAEVTQDDAVVVAPPHGYTAMCENDVALCAALAATNPGPVATNIAAQRDLVKRINHEVNARVHQQSDLETVGVVEKWRRAGLDRRATGDCEDIAIEKRLELIAAGFPAEHLSFAVGYRSEIGLHAVLVAQIDGEDIVLDSRSAALASWRRAPYIWVSRQTPGAPDRWTDPLSHTVTAQSTRSSEDAGTSFTAID